MNQSINSNAQHGTTLVLRSAMVFALIALLTLAREAGAQEVQGRLATPLELRQMHDAGQYRTCLQQIGRILRAGDAAKSYDRYDLLLLRGDCLLHLEDPATAQLVFSYSAKSPVPQQARIGRATAFLLQRSTRMMYQPRDDRDSDGINLASDEGRNQALRALLKDELGANETKFDRAVNADNLVPIRDVLTTLADLYAVERTATGGDAQMRPILEAIGQRARTLIDRELDLREQTIGALDRRANLPVDAPGGGWWWSGYARRGLNTYDRRELRELIDYLQRIQETTKLGRELAAFFDGDTKVWEPLIARATKAVRGAQDVLEAE